jgi:hypothetical protein
MSIQSFLLGQAMKWKMKDVPPEQRDQIMALVQKDPELFKKIGEEVDKRVKGGEPQMKASLAVMKKHGPQLRTLMQK